MPLYTDYILKVKDTNLQTLGFSPATMEGNWDSPAQSFERVNVPFREGTTRTTQQPKIEPLRFHFTGELSASSEEAFETARDTLLYLLSFDDVAILVGNQPNRQRIGTLEGAVHIRPSASSADGLTVAAVDFTLVCDNPVTYATSVTNVSGAVATDHSLPLGTRKTFGVITIESATDPLLTYKHYDGTTLATLQLTGTGDFIVDLYERRFWLDGDRDDSVMTDGDFFAFDPRHGDYLTSHWPTLRTSSGTLSVDYYKAYP